MVTTDVNKWLENLAGGTKRVRLNARTAAELVTNTHCSARRALDAAGIDKSKLADQLGSPADRGQSPFAIGRGNQFERRVKRDEYLELLGLLKQQGLDTTTVDIFDLKTDLPFTPANADEVLAARAKATRDEIVRIAKGEAPAGRVIDGAALTWDIGGIPVRLETDALAWWVGGKLRVVEMKSYPIEWGQIAADKIAALAWQTAVYVAAVQDLLVEEGLDPDFVSTEIYLVCPKNTGLQPVVVPHNVAPQLRLLRRFRSQAVSLEELADLVGAVSVDVSALPSGEQADALAKALEQLRPSYQPNCLTTCDLAAHCRSCAQAQADPHLFGGEVVQLMVGMTDLHRAAELLNGAAPATPTESDFVAMTEAGRAAERAVLNP